MRITMIIVLFFLMLSYLHDLQDTEEELKQVKLENTELKLKLQEDKCYCTKLKFCDTLTDKQAEHAIRRHNNR